jgi:predicted dinucleotide-binding enzyme
MFAGARVVKAFNVLSAYSLVSGDLSTQMVPMASDCTKAKEIVSDLIKKMGYIPEDRGMLTAARLIEAIPQRRFDSWHLALAISSCLW